MATALRTKRETVNGWETGRTTPRPPRLAAYKRLFDGWAEKSGPGVGAIEDQGQGAQPVSKARPGELELPGGRPLGLAHRVDTISTIPDVGAGGGSVSEQHEWWRHLEIRQPAEVLEFSDDLFVVDVDPLRDFLAARLAEFAAAQPEGSEARWAAQRLADVTRAACRHLEQALLSWEAVLATGRAEEGGLVETLRRSLGPQWNQLVVTASRFADHPEYLPRWRQLRQLNAQYGDFAVEAGGGH
ncbi:hypothetical protein [Streptomyces griseosporeus]|uniref:hypothetical protein n=1 Tax=Streptomyces griseosporeus TaxID=1910 RepID=UPI0036F6732E